MKGLVPDSNAHEIGIRRDETRRNLNKFMHALFKYFVGIRFGSVCLVGQQDVGSVFNTGEIISFLAPKKN